MTVVLVPVGKGNWRRLDLQIELPADLFPSIRDNPIRVRSRWFLAERWWRVVEIRA